MKYLVLIVLFGIAFPIYSQTPPEPAKKYGLTYCGFNEDFNNYINIDINNTGDQGYNFYPKVIWSKRTIDSTEASVRNGILTLECKDNSAQGDLFSAYKVSNTQFHGWYHDMATQGAVYFEARVRWKYSEIKDNPDGFPAFWSNPVEFADWRTNAPYHHYTELDFFEFNPRWTGGDHSRHLQGLPPWQREPGGRWERYVNPISEECLGDDCVIMPHLPASWNYNLTDAQTGQRMTSSLWNNWQTVGFLVIPGDGTADNPTRCISYFNGKKKKERIDTSWDGDSTWRESKNQLSPDEVGFAPMPGLRHQRYMIIIGSGQWKTQWDFVRAWQLPKVSANDHFCTSHAPPSIDGTVEDAWHFVQPDILNNKLQGAPESVTDFSASSRVKWDDQSLYLLIEVQDDNLVNDSGNQPWKDDAVEVFVDGDNDTVPAYDANDHQFIFRWNDDTVHHYQQEIPQPVNPEGITCVQKNTETGYLMEIQIDWSAVGTDPAEEQLIGFDIQINDDDDHGSREHKIAWLAATDQAAENSSTVGTILLEDDICGACHVTASPENKQINFNTDVAFQVKTEKAFSYQWQLNAGSGFSDIADDPPYAGTQTKQLVISDATENLSGNRYRCIISNPINSDTSLAAVLTVTDMLQPEILSAPGDQILEATEGCQVKLPDYTTAVEATDNYDDALEITQSPDSGSLISGGHRQVTISVTDDNGNTAQRSFSVQVTDAEPPVIISAPEDQTLEANAQCQGVLPDYSAFVVTSDNCYRAGELQIIQTPAPYTSIADTANEITLTITDPEENKSDTSFWVYVTDQTKPTLQCPEDQQLSLQQGQTAYTVSGSAFDPVSTDDNCAVDSITNDFNNRSTLTGAEFPLDTTTVVWSVNDRAGNIAQCSFDVVVGSSTGFTLPAKHGINIYPNPTGEVLHYETNHNKIQKIKLLDITGNKILEINDPDTNGTLEVAHLTSGIYFIHLSTRDGRWTRKIIKK